jgi:hypothetical protein
MLFKNAVHTSTKIHGIVSKTIKELIRVIAGSPEKREALLNTLWGKSSGFNAK